MINRPETLPGLAVPSLADPLDGTPGPVEAGVLTALESLEAGGWMTPAHSHIKALAVSTARKFDSLAPSEKAYGYAQITQALTKVFELLPTPDAGAETKWNEWLDILESAADNDR